MCIRDREMREYRGTLKEPGKNSPYRDRSVEENLRLFEEMREGRYKDGEKVLRAKIDMASPDINMRDPVIYRVAHMSHHNTGDKWCIDVYKRQLGRQTSMWQDLRQPWTMISIQQMPSRQYLSL